MKAVNELIQFIERFLLKLVQRIGGKEVCKHA